MKLPLTLPLDSYPPRDMQLIRRRGRQLHPIVLQIEVHSIAEAQSLEDWLTRLNATAPGPADQRGS